MKPAKTGVSRLIDATRYSGKGLRACWRHEAAFRQELLLFLVLLPCSVVVAKTPVQWLLLVMPLLILLIVELMNSAIENVVDRIGDDFHELSGRAKDMGSAAVFICLVMTGLSWITIGAYNYLGVL